MIFLDIAIVTAWLAVLAVVGLHLGRLSIWPLTFQAADAGVSHGVNHTNMQ
jgi:hypothetical protein